MSYADDLRDPRWQRLRLEIMSRDNWRCCACMAEDRPLNVHHKRYATHSMRPWDVGSECLETLCEPCHVSRHFPGDLDLEKLTISELKDFVGWSWIEEEKADNDATLAYHAAKQEQAWLLIFSRRARGEI